MDRRPPSLRTIGASTSSEPDTSGNDWSWGGVAYIDAALRNAVLMTAFEPLALGAAERQDGLPKAVRMQDAAARFDDGYLMEVGDGFLPGCSGLMQVDLSPLSNITNVGAA